MHKKRKRIVQTQIKDTESKDQMIKRLEDIRINVNIS